jgi:peptide/nickel transport system substrate-binding protein
MGIPLHSRVGGLVIPAAIAISLSGLQSREEDTPVREGEPGKRGGRLVASLRSDPKTFNPLLVRDVASRSVVELMMSDLVHINRETHLTEPSLAKSWEVSEDGRRYRLELRRGLCFSDGHPLDADDVVFTFKAYLDETLGAPQRDLLVVGGKPIEVRKLDAYRVEFQLAEPYGAGERIFDLVAILPRHLLEKPYQEGRLASLWGPDVSPRDIAGLGPFRLKEYVSGQSILLERNPCYWKTDAAGERLPYLDEILFLISSGEPADVLRFRSGEIHIISGLGAQSFDAISRETDAGRHQLRDLGPGLEYTFLFFNLNDLGDSGRTEIVRKQGWFRSTAFRQAISSAIDRESVVDLVYQGRAAALSSHVTPGNRLWRNPALTPTAYDVSRSRALLRSAGFRFSDSGSLLDPAGQPVSFSLLVGAGNPARAMIATVLQDDLKKIGVEVQVVTLDFAALLDRIFESFDYEASILAFGSSDVDPTAELATLLSGGGMHVWRLGDETPPTQWEAEIDRLMLRQMTSTDAAERKLLYHRVQEIVASELPIVPLVSPHILVGADRRLGNFRPAVLAPYTLWNAEELFFRSN